MNPAPRCDACKFYLKMDSKKGECRGAPPQTWHPLKQAFVFPWVRRDD